MNWRDERYEEFKRWNYWFGKQRLLADERCYSFNARHQGYGGM